MSLPKKLFKKLGGIFDALDILEHTSRLAQPFVQDARAKSIENAKRIYAHQYVEDGLCTIIIEKAEIIARGASFEEAFEKFIERLKDLRENKVVSSNKKTRAIQKKLIDKIDRILSEGDDLKPYIFRIHIEENHQSRRSPMKINRIYRRPKA